VSAARVLVVHNAASDRVGRLGGWLESTGLALDLCEPFAGAALPENLAGIDGLLVLGGDLGVGDDGVAHWLPALRRLMADALEREVPTLGICLGAQLLAVAAGGRVGVNPAGPQLGAQLIAKRANAATDPLFGPLPITPDVIQWHFDAVLELPPSAVLLASSPGCEVEAFRIGRLAWGLQFHIETQARQVREWAVDDADRLSDYDLERILCRSDAAHDDVAEAWEPFALAWAAVVRDPSSVKPARTLRVSTAEPVTDPAEIRAALAAQMRAATAPMPLASLPWPDAERPPAS
jgi:GMP synthase (glutamine-hydrolysing)